MSAVTSRPTALELCLRQKLTLMENALAQIAAVKSHLKTNAEQTRKDIALASGQLIELVRAREQALLAQLDEAVDHKDTVLSRQQEHLNQAIGACQQSLEVVRRNGGEDGGINVQDMLFRLNTMDLTPRAHPHVAFEADNLGLRSKITDFGRVFCVEKASTHGRSLPLQLAEHEDDMDMGHKSVLRYQRDGAVYAPPDTLLRGHLATGRTSNVGSGVDSIRQWIASSGGADDFEIIRSRNQDRTISMSNSSSVEVIDNPMSAASSVISGAFREQMRAPAEAWLQRGSKKTEQPPKALPANALKRRTSADDGLSTSYDFERVINAVKKSDNAQWISNNGKRPRTTSMRTTSMSSLLTATEDGMEEPEDAAEDEEQVVPGMTRVDNLSDITPKIPLFFPSSTSTADTEELAKKLKGLKANPSSIDEMLAKLAQQFDSQRWIPEGANTNEGEKKAQKANDLAKDINQWDAVLGWKNILERIHACGEDNWLSPSSRQL